MNAVHRLTPKAENDVFTPNNHIFILEKDFQKIQQRYPEIVWEEKPGVAVYCLPLDYFTDSSLINGAAVIVKATGKGAWVAEALDEKFIPEVTLQVFAKPNLDTVYVSILISLPSDSHNSLIEYMLSQIPPNQSESASFEPAYTDYHSKILSAHQYLQSILPREFRVYQSITQHRIQFSLDLSAELPWFKDWLGQRFLNIKNITNSFHFSINAHNGINMDNSMLLDFSQDFSSRTVLMLKDEYCPNLNLSRNYIQSLPLDTFCDLDAISDQIQHSLEIYTRSTFYTTYFVPHLVPVKDYWDLLNNKPLLASQLHFITDTGEMTISEIDHILQIKNKISLKINILSPLHIAALMQKFTLRIMSYHGGVTSICVIDKSCSTFSKTFSAFPPALFLPPSKNNFVVFTAYVRLRNACLYPYNAEHPFSKWLIQNQSVLQRSVPGLYNQIILRLQSGDALIDRINSLLSQLRQIPPLGIDIAADLTIDDFLIISDDE